MASKPTNAVFIAAMLGLAAVTPLAAAPAMTKIDIAAFDPDKDGTIDLNEAQAAAAAAFDKLEADKDGTLDAKELKGRMSDADIKQADPDGDGTVDKKEYLALVISQFKAADPDGDGTVDARELASPAGSALVQMMR